MAHVKVPVTASKDNPNVVGSTLFTKQSGVAVGDSEGEDVLGAKLGDMEEPFLLFPFPASTTLWERRKH